MKPTRTIAVLALAAAIVGASATAAAATVSLGKPIHATVQGAHDMWFKPPSRAFDTAGVMWVKPVRAFGADRAF